MFGFREMSQTLDEMMGNVSVAINGFESPAKPFKSKTNTKKGLAKSSDGEKKPINWNKMLNKQQQRRGDK